MGEHWSAILAGPQRREAERASQVGSVSTPTSPIGTANALSQYGSFLKDHWSTILKDPAQGFSNALQNTFSMYPSDRGVNALNEYLRTGVVPEDLPQVDMNQLGSESLDLVFPMVGTIAGVGAKTANKAALDLAQSLKKAGVPEDEIFSRTNAEFGQGWWLGHPDTKPRFEIDDSQSALFVGDKPSTGSLSHYLVHEPLYKNYPDMELTGYAYRPGERGGSYFPDQDLMIVRSNDPSSAKSTTLHEVQHAVSGREGFARGGTPGVFARDIENADMLIGVVNNKLSDIVKQKDKIATTIPKQPGDIESLRELDDQYNQLMSYKLNELLPRAQADPYQQYRHLADESQARLTQSRMDMTQSERAANPFYKNYDVPLNEMILRYDRVPSAMKTQDWYGGKPPSSMSEDEFLKLHKTGYIDPSAYKSYEKEGGLSWLGTAEKYPVVSGNIKGKSGKSYEIRKSGEKNKYVKLDDSGEIVRDEKGLATYLTDAEVKESGKPLYSQDMVIFDGDKPIGLASNEFGSIGVWVEGPYQKQGIGSELLTKFMKENPGMQIGQMTPAGENLTRSAHKKLSKMKKNSPDDFGLQAGGTENELNALRRHLSDKDILNYLNTNAPMLLKRQAD